MKILTCFYHEELEEFEVELNYLVIPQIGHAIFYKGIEYIVKDFVHDLDSNKVYIIIELAD